MLIQTPMVGGQRVERQVSIPSRGVYRCYIYDTSQANWQTAFQSLSRGVCRPYGRTQGCLS